MERNIQNQMTDASINIIHMSVNTINKARYNREKNAVPSLFIYVSRYICSLILLQGLCYISKYTKGFIVSDRVRERWVRGGERRRERERERGEREREREGGGER